MGLINQLITGGHHILYNYIYTLVGGLEHVLIFPYIGNVKIPTDFHSIIFQRGRSGRYTTNQYIYILNILYYKYIYIFFTYILSIYILHIIYIILWNTTRIFSWHRASSKYPQSSTRHGSTRGLGDSDAHHGHRDVHRHLTVSSKVDEKIQRWSWFHGGRSTMKGFMDVGWSFFWSLMILMGVCYPKNLELIVF